LAVDAYAEEDGVLLDGFSIGFCTLVNVVAGLQQVALGATQVVGTVSVLAGSAQGDSVGIAMKGGNTGDVVPVLLYGVAKLTIIGTGVAGVSVESGVTSGQAVPVATQTAGAFTRYKTFNWTGTAFILGKMLQTAATSGDSVLVLINAI
jgi:hypothetical protein